MDKSHMVNSHSSTQDPSSTTRRNYTLALITPQPITTHPSLRPWLQTLSHLILLLSHHPAMQENLDQLCVSAPAYPNPVLFAWQYASETLGLINALHRGRHISDQGEQAATVVSRSYTAGKLILGHGGLLLGLAPDSRGRATEWGEEILGCARDLYTDPRPKGVGWDPELYVRLQQGGRPG